MFIITSSLLIAYLIGSIPTAYLLGKYFFDKDIRQLGSGNSGATNIFRVFGFWPAITVLMLDILKGYFATSISDEIGYQVFLGLMVIIGHIFPIFSRFRGGKAVTTTFGCFIAINPLVLIIPVIVWIFTFTKSKISSLSSIASIWSLCLSMILIETHPMLNLFTLIVLVIVTFSHRKNIQRLLNGEEKKLF